MSTTLHDDQDKTIHEITIELKDIESAREFLNSQRYIGALDSHNITVIISFNKAGLHFNC